MHPYARLICFAIAGLAAVALAYLLFLVLGLTKSLSDSPLFFSLLFVAASLAGFVVLFSVWLPAVIPTQWKLARVLISVVCSLITAQLVFTAVWMLYVDPQGLSLTNDGWLTYGLGLLVLSLVALTAVWHIVSLFKKT